MALALPHRRSDRLDRRRARGRRWRRTVGGALTGAGAQGAAQWLAAKDMFGQWPIWVGASSVGYAVGLAAGAALVGYETDIGSLAAMGAVSGVVLGAAQGLALAMQGREGLALAWGLAMPWCCSPRAGRSRPSAALMLTSSSRCSVPLARSTMSDSTNTVRLHRVLRAPAERVYKAFLDPEAMVKWLPPHGFTGKVHEMDARVGGGYRMSFTNFGTGKSHSFGGKYVELTPHERIRYTDKFDDPNLPGEMQRDDHAAKVLCGTELTIVQEGIPAAIPGRVLLPRLAGVAGAAGPRGRAGDSGRGVRQ